MIYIIDCGHAEFTKGKRSPDGKFLEYKQNRIIGQRVYAALSELGLESHFTCELDSPNDLSLTKRAEVANKYSRKYGAKNVLLISIHFNAAGNGSSWTTANGWEIYTTKGTTTSDKYATIFYEEAEKIWNKKYGRKMRKDTSDGDPDKEENFTVIYKTICPAILLEQGFYDNQEEMNFLLSEDGIQCCTDIIVNSIKRIENIE